jgi:hypothetical protein
VAAGDAVVFAAVFALAALLVFPFVVLVLVVSAGVETGAGVAVLTLALFAGRLALTLTFVAVSPQAMPIALNPRTVESTITFFIIIQTPKSFSKIFLPI